MLLTTDDPAIAEHGRWIGWQAPFLRPAALASDTAGAVDTVIHALDWRRDAEGRDPEFVLLAQITTPFRQSADIVQALARLRYNAALDAIIGVRTVAGGAGWLFQEGADGEAASVPLPVDEPVHAVNGALYLIRTEVLRRDRTFFPPRLGLVKMDAVHSIDIDTADELGAGRSGRRQRACKILAEQFQLPPLFNVDALEKSHYVSNRFIRYVPHILGPAIFGAPHDCLKGGEVAYIIGIFSHELLKGDAEHRFR